MRNILLAALLLFVSASARAQSGTLFIVGGGPQPPALVKEFVDLAGGSKAQIIVFGMASADGQKGGEEKASDLRALGAGARSVWINREQADMDSVAQLLANATGIWFIGGDQNKLVKVLRGTRTDQMIKARYAAGAVIGGTSAGAAVMSALMLTGDEKHPGGDRPVRDSSSANAYLTIARDNIVLDDGFGLISNAIVDQHFLRRKRHNRLISVVLEREPHLGVGIDESTALVVQPDGTWRVSGASVAVIYDARQARTSPAGSTLGASGMSMHVLPAGSRFDPRTAKATLPQ